MQALWRGHAVRSEEEVQLLAELQELEFLAAQRIQARVRGVTTRAELAQVFAQVEEDMRQVAAIHIQASIWAWGSLHPTQLRWDTDTASSGGAPRVLSRLLT